MISDSKHEKSFSISSDQKLQNEENLPAYSVGTAGAQLSVEDHKDKFDIKGGATPFDAYPVPNNAHVPHAPHNAPAEPANSLNPAETQRLRRIAIAILVLSKITAVLLLVNFVTILTGPFTKIYENWDNYNASKADLPLMILMTLSFLYALFAVIHTPRRAKLYNAIRSVLDVVFFANIIPQAVRLAKHYPRDNWCHTTFMVAPHATITPGAADTIAIGPDPDCNKWRLLCRVLTVVGTALGVVVAALYLYSVIYRTVAWKRVCRRKGGRDGSAGN